MSVISSTFNLYLYKTPQLTPRGFANSKFSYKIGLSLRKHPLEQLLYRRHGGDDDAQQRIHADREEVIHQRIRPDIGEPEIRRIGAEKHSAGYR